MEGRRKWEWEGRGRECCPLQLGPAEDEEEGTRARRGACVGASRHFFPP